MPVLTPVSVILIVYIRIKKTDQHSVLCIHTIPSGAVYLSSGLLKLHLVLKKGAVAYTYTPVLQTTL